MLSADSLKKQLDQYVENTLQIRSLSGAGALGIESEEGYMRALKQRFRKTEALGKENRRILSETLYPVLQDEQPLAKPVHDALTEFSGYLLNPWPEEELDLSLLFEVTRRLVKDALVSGSADEIAEHLNFHIYACYNNVNRFGRVKLPENEAVRFFQKEGLASAKLILSFLDHEKFLSLKKPESRKLVVGQARFWLALYDTFRETDENINDLRIRGLIGALSMADDPFFVENTPGIDWRYHRLRTLEHMGQLSENGNQWQLTKSQLKLVYEYTKDLERIWQEKPEESEKILPKVHLDLILCRNAYYGGKIKLSAYQETLLSLYDTYALPEYDMYSVLANIFIPVEYLATLTPESASEHGGELSKLYNGVISYLMHCPTSGAFSFCMEYLSAFLDRFIETEGGMRFEQAALSCMAALHPPTYVHSLQTAELAVCLGRHLLLKNPAYFGEAFPEGIREAELLSMLRHAGLCHDIGKLYMIDTVFVYGRDLTAQERELLRLHSLMSQKALARRMDCPEMEEAVALSHLGFDKTCGYPLGTLSPRQKESPLTRCLRSVLHVADCLDAATDPIGRSYKKSKSLSRVAAELKKGAGTQYDPALARLLEDTQVLVDISELLSNGRKHLYRKAWDTLSDIRKSAPAALKLELKYLAARTERVRRLSSPDISEVEGDASYGKLLRSHFEEIRRICVANRSFLEEILYPILDSKQPIDEQTADRLFSLCDELVNGRQLGDLDCRLLYRISGRLLKEEKKRGEPERLIRQLDLHITACYELSRQIKRMKTADDLGDAYRREGLSASGMLCSFLDKKRFAGLSDHAKSVILLHSRYDAFLYDINNSTETLNRESMQMLKRSYALLQDPFYTENAPAYDWNYHRIRCLEYIGQQTECGNARGFDEDAVRQIADCGEKLLEYWKKDPEKNSKVLFYPNLMLIYLRGRYLAGRITREEYREKLLMAYESADPTAYDFYQVLLNLLLPLEYLISMGPEPDAEETGRINDMYGRVISYIFLANKSDTFDLILEYYSEFLFSFRELSEGMTFERMGLLSMAAFHPPTYVHSRMVGELSRRLCAALLEKSPELFLGFSGYDSLKEVMENKQAIVEHSYHAGLCHDFGKLPMIDTISVYGRRLFDSEFALLKCHPLTGTRLLKKHPSTRNYAVAAALHHRFYNGEKGYPDRCGELTKEETDRLDPGGIMTGILSVADSLDAATDTVGRSYTGGKDMDGVIEEILEMRGSRYHPAVAVLFESRRIREEVESVLTVRRGECYTETFRLIEGYFRDI